jgi:YVTN family beta-propeller protein
MKRFWTVSLLVSLLAVATAGPVLANTGDPNAYVPSKFAVGAAPKGIAVGGTSNLGVAVNSGANSVTLFNTCAPKSCQPDPNSAVTVPVGKQPSDVAIWFDPKQGDVARAYVTNSGDGTMTIIPVSVYSVQVASSPTSFKVGGEPTGVAVSADGRWVYISEKTSNSLIVYDTVGQRIDATVPVGAGPWGVAVSADGATAYVANNGAGTVSVVNTTTRQVVATIPVGLAPADLAPLGKSLYVANNGSGSISVIDSTSNKVIKTVTVGDQPWGVAATGSAVFVANYGSGTVSVIDAASLKLVSTIKSGVNPFGVGMNGQQTVLVSNSGSNNLSNIAQRAPVPAVSWTSSKSAKSVTGSVPFMPAVTYSMVATKGSTSKKGSCSTSISGSSVVCKVTLSKGTWRVSILTRLPWQPVAAGQQNKKFTF